jgi:hypothetical protein
MRNRLRRPDTANSHWHHANSHWHHMRPRLSAGACAAIVDDELETSDVSIPCGIGSQIFLSRRHREYNEAGWEPLITALRKPDGFNRSLCGAGPGLTHWRSNETSKAKERGASYWRSSVRLSFWSRRMIKACTFNRRVILVGSVPLTFVHNRQLPA